LLPVHTEDDDVIVSSTRGVTKHNHDEIADGAILTSAAALPILCFRSGVFLHKLHEAYALLKLLSIW
jgi:hypothetical protein